VQIILNVELFSADHIKKVTLCPPGRINKRTAIRWATNYRLNAIGKPKPDEKVKANQYS